MGKVGQRPESHRTGRRSNGLLIFAGLLLLAFAAPQPIQGAAAAPSREETLGYLDRNQHRIQSKLRDYNETHRLLSTSRGGWKVTLQSWRLKRIEGGRAFVEIDYKVGGVVAYQRSGSFLFELAWVDNALEFQRHWTPGDETLSAAAAVATPGAPPTLPLDQVEAYFERNLADITAKLRAYNEENQVARYKWDSWQVALDAWRIERLDGDRAFVAIEFGVGSATQKAPGSALFELQWVGGDLEFVGHEKITSRTKITGGPDPGHDACVYNYYSPRPCLDVMRKWSEFANLHDLPMDQESAAILQAYKQLDYDRGDELMATVKGLARPVETSVFDLQNEVTTMNLPGTARETDCAWNPYAPKPCPEALRVFRAFAARHGLEPDAASANMFEAYSRGNFKKADVIYALAKNLDVPAYGHIPTVAARDLASHWPEMNRMALYGGVECEMNPHSQKPCAGVVPLWREFAARYGLEDIPDNGRIFQAYQEGDFEKGDTHLAKAFGVPLETLLEAAGIPSRNLTIEVYPGWRQMLRDLLIGT